MFLRAKTDFANRCPLAPSLPRIAVLLSLTLVLSGCHKKQQHVARRPPPPPITSQRYPTVARRPVPPVILHDPSEDSNPSGHAPQPHVDNNSVSSSETGLASWYGPPYHNRTGANGEIYDQNAMTAAHRTLPMGTIVRVTNLSTNQSVTVKITDRGPFVQGRIIDLSLAAAKETGLYRMGVAKVRVEVFAAQRPLTGGKWCVQVGAFQNEGNANKLKSDLLRRYETAKVIEFPGPTGHWVRINPALNDRAHATQIADNIRTAEPDAQAYIVRLD
ncbi:septal ring lytic transglycosylase RlpA family protein [Terriglobus saanensis]|uniref:Probable endolytic peptidoglycan transglycosylase RlpA n=1 Tax=Terriglobus saanensis (strain ATCC BAA-1853 / DSM 23119 / SP1PR4) TaxID=401053 RepID=E8V243_TERSS|nr:septal ring lytic transglycosylase RlpA family protein [Terriglobus saanensis]ADV84600.1 rare lipoprotein A [Terriglobus saanensis SP1PR4]